MRIQSGPWPRPNRPPWYNDAPFPAERPVLSLSGAIRGITLGGCAPCPSSQCDGFLIAVDWETGQLTFPCCVGWEDRGDHIRIVAGGEITGRVVNRVDPIPRDEWPERELTIDVEWPWTPASMTPPPLDPEDVAWLMEPTEPVDLDAIPPLPRGSAVLQLDSETLRERSQGLVDEP